MSSGILPKSKCMSIIVVRPRKFENAVDLCLVFAVVAWGRTDGPGTTVQCLNEEGIRLGLACQAFLREGTNFDIDGPRIILRRHHHPFQTD